jgi:hypothetical protein
MKRLLILLALLFNTACADDATAPAAGGSSVVRVRSQTSFGFCAGYCTTEMLVDSLQARLISRSFDAERYPTRTVTQTITLQDWRQLTAAIDTARFSRLDPVYGCPDCADGGAELVELEWGSQRRQVSFEYGKPPAPMQALRDQIWQLRERLRDGAGGDR